MSHCQHNHQPPANKQQMKLLMTVFAFNFILASIEALVAVVFSSDLILADALHNFSDVAFIGSACLVAWVSGSKDWISSSFKSDKLEPLFLFTINLIIALATLLALFHLTQKAWPWLLNFATNPLQLFTFHSTTPQWILIVIASIALLINLISAFWLAKGTGHLNHNMMQHMLLDAFGSIMAVLTLFINWQTLNLVVSFILYFFTLYVCFDAIKKSIPFLLDFSPPAPLIHVIHQLYQQHGFTAPHEEHIWALNHESWALSVHLRLSDHVISKQQIQTQLSLLEQQLARHQITHSTIQIELSHENDNHCTEHCNEHHKPLFKIDP